MSSATKLLRLGQAAGVLVICLLLSACQGKATKENFDKINTGMTLEEVEKILGAGSKQGGDGSGVAAQVGVNIQGAGGAKNQEEYLWQSGDHEIRVYFGGGKVKQKSFK